MIESEKIYSRRIEKYRNLIEKQNKKIKKLGNLRLLIFLIGAAFSIMLYREKNYYLCLTSFLVFLILFIWVAVIHSKIINNRKYSTILHDINVNCIKRLKGEWVNFSDTGEEFIDGNHSYSSDLDIFGKNSLFQCINASSTYSGRLKLKEKLSIACTDEEEIKLKQEAIKELSKKIGFRQRLMAEALVLKPINEPLDSLYSWGKDLNQFYEKTWFVLLARFIPVLTVFITILPFISHKVPFYVPLIMYFINSLILVPYSEKKTKILKDVTTYKSSLVTYHNMFKIIEKTRFESTYLKKINLSSSSKQIDKLITICEMIALRSSSIYSIINVFLLWDYQCLISLQKWKKVCGNDLEIWIDSVGELEALSSLSIIHFDNRDWAFPKISGEKLSIDALEIGHPLLSEKRVRNDVSIGENSNVLLITGSNMSGKSTFLRTIGINLVLAYTGAPVCAKKLNASIMDLYTCMRISDNLEESISSFYAELIRIKLIVSAAKEGKRIFFLLDEIFKGTNSLDRHTGAKVLIKQLQSYGAIGLISTHDLELGELEKESNAKVRNFHFREYYENNEIFFDYKLRPGISTTRNALFLIKLAGLDIDNFKE